MALMQSARPSTSRMRDCKRLGDAQSIVARRRRLGDDPGAGDLAQCFPHELLKSCPL